MQLTNVYNNLNHIWNTHVIIENGNMQDTKSLLLSSKYKYLNMIGRNTLRYHLIIVTLIKMCCFNLLWEHHWLMTPVVAPLDPLLPFILFIPSYQPAPTWLLNMAGVLIQDYSWGTHDSSDRYLWIKDFSSV